jgi:hypothetical protein
MIWLGTSPHEPGVKRMLDRHDIGLLCQPVSHLPQAGWIWAADNGCFSDKWDADRWLSWLHRPMPRAGCLFATVPDVVANHRETMRRWDTWSPVVHATGFPVAFVAQNGSEDGGIPWDEVDAVFIGGDTEWKMSLHAFRIAREAKERGKWVHVGRVNSLKRLREWAGYADSSDGTFLAFGPAKNSVRVEGWVEALRTDRQEALDWVR